MNRNAKIMPEPVMLITVAKKKRCSPGENERKRGVDTASEARGPLSPAVVILDRWRGWLPGATVRPPKEG
jgi:hypothetical protein